MLKGMAGGAPSVVSLTISADTNDYNIFTAAGSPGTAKIVTLTINTGVIVGKSSAVAALRTGGFPSGSSINIVNNGKIYGAGGAGGSGGNSPSLGVGFSGTDGDPGSNAIQLDDNVTIDNTNGYIWGGSGGGGGAGARYVFASVGGGGGGGGQGAVGGSAGGGGTGAQYNGGNGNAGTTSYQGGGGPTGDGYSSDHGGDGGFGASVGSAGANGDGGAVGGAGGAPGKAVYLNGKTVSWLGGYNSTQVKGAVS